MVWSSVNTGCVILTPQFFFSLLSYRYFDDDDDDDDTLLDFTAGTILITLHDILSCVCGDNNIVYRFPSGNIDITCQ